MTVSMVVAVSANNVIGNRGRLPWHLPEDLKRFKALTLGKPVIMGRLTHEAIGRALPGRRNIVLTSDEHYRSSDCLIASTPDEAMELAADADEVMIIGGAYVYREFMPITGRIYLTRVHASIEGDAFFPELDPRQWRVSVSEELPADGERPYACTFQTLDRIGNAG